MRKAGEELKEARLEKGLSLEDVSKSTKIKLQFLEYIEKGEYGKLPSVSYAQGFVRNYARFLKVNEKTVMAIFRREFDEEKTFRVLPKGFDKTEEFPIRRLKFSRAVFLTAAIFVIFLGYLLFQYREAFISPPLSINSPLQNSTVSSSLVTVSGKTDPNSTVYVDGNAVSIDENGNFKKTLNVFPGKVVITVKAINKFLKVSQKQITINVNQGP